MVQRRSVTVLALTLLLLATAGIGAGAARASAPPPTRGLGPNVTVFDPSMPVSEIQAAADAIHAKQVDAEMGTDRYALLFKPGVYGSAAEPLQIKVGYYTEVAGLGASPADVTINGKIEVYNRCLADGGTSNCLALVNFWRSLSNLTLNVNAAGQDGCRSSANFWAVSQAASMRRLAVTGGQLSLMDYCTAGPQYASGGFIADSKPGSVNEWLAAAVADPQQRDHQLVERRLEPGLRGRRRRAVRSHLPEPSLHDARDDAGQPREALPVRGRARQASGPRAVGADQHERHVVGRRHDRGPHDPAPRLLRRDAV